MPELPKRSRKFGVGKEIGGAVYVHRSSEDLLGGAVAAAKQKIADGFEYDVVKYAQASGAVSFIQSPDFDTADEPAVGEIVTVNADGSIRRRRPPADPEIYHHKWLFVDDDYAGFDVEASRERSRQWMSLDGIDYRRIGRQSYWQTNVVPRIPSC